MATVESFGLKYIQNVIERVENRQPSAMVKVYAAFRVSLRTHARSVYFSFAIIDRVVGALALERTSL